MVSVRLGEGGGEDAPVPEGEVVVVEAGGACDVGVRGRVVGVEQHEAARVLGLGRLDEPSDRGRRQVGDRLVTGHGDRAPGHQEETRAGRAGVGEPVLEQGQRVRGGRVRIGKRAHALGCSRVSVRRVPGNDHQVVVRTVGSVLEYVVGTGEAGRSGGFRQGGGSGGSPGDGVELTGTAPGVRRDVLEVMGVTETVRAVRTGRRHRPRAGFRRPPRPRPRRRGPCGRGPTWPRVRAG